MIILSIGSRGRDGGGSKFGEIHLERSGESLVGKQSESNVPFGQILEGYLDSSSHVLESQVCLIRRCNPGNERHQDRSEVGWGIRITQQDIHLSAGHRRSRKSGIKGDPRVGLTFTKY